MPFAVAITRLAREYDPGSYRTAPTVRPLDPERWLPPLATRLGLTAYDLRMRLTGESPWVIATVRGAEEAAALVSSLRAAGFGAVQCDLAARPWAPADDLSLRLLDDALALDPTGGRVPYAALRLIVLATLDTEHGDESVERVVVAQHHRREPVVVEVSRFSYARKRQRVLYLYSGDGLPAVRLEQESLRTTGVVGRTSRERFDHVVEAVRARCPDARFDERLVAGPRRRTSFTLSPMERARRGSVSDNASDTDLAAWALALATEAGQL